MGGGNRRRRWLLAATALASGCLALSTIARAANIDWVGGTSTDWFTAGNWSTGVPSSSDVAALDTITPNPTIIDTNSAQASAFRAGFNNTGNLTIQSGGTLSVVSGFIANNSGSTGVLTVDGASSSLTASSYIYLGQGGDGTVTVQNGGSVSTGLVAMALNSGASGTLTVDGTGSSFAMSGNLLVGVAGSSATVNIQNGGTLTDSRGYIGTNASGGPATVTVTGSGSTWTTTSGLYLGQNSAGTLTIQNGGAVNAGGSYVQVGYSSGSNGTLNIGAASGQTAVAPGTLSATAVQFGSGTGKLVFNHTDSNYTFGVIILGTGAVEVDAGTTILTVNNTYSGSTTINGGTLQIGAGSYAGTIATDVTDNGTLAFNRSNAYTYAGVISGTGAVHQDGTGTTILTGTNNNTGGTTINAGILQVGNGGTTGSITGDVTNDATLVIKRSDALTFSGNISGTGAVHQDGTGTTILTGTNNYTGGTTINAGTLQIGNGGTTGSITGDVTSKGTLAFDRSDTLTFAGVISDNGSSGAVEQNGTGNLILSGSNTYSGATTVNAGTLSVNGSIAASTVTVNAGGTLGGNGTVGPTTIASGGALAPGNSIGTVTVNGNLTFNAGSSYNVQVSPSAADRTNVTGSATLAGTVNASYAPGSYTAKQYTILNAAGGVSGTFSALTNTDLPSNVNAALSYDANDVYLDLTLNFDPPSGGLSSNQGNVVTALTDYFNRTGGIPTAFITLTPAELRQISGEAGASVVTPMFNDNDQFIDTAFNGAFDCGFGDGAPAFAWTGHEAALGYAPRPRLSREAAEAYAAVMPVKAKPYYNPVDYDPIAARWRTWTSIYGANGRVVGNATVGSSTTTSRAYGLAAGASYWMAPDTIVGLALGGAGTSFWLDDGLGSGKTDDFHAGLYGRYTFGQAYVAGLLSYGWHDVTTDRTVTVAGADTLHAAFQTSSYGGRAEAGYRFADPRLDVTPYGAVQATTFALPAYSETVTSGSDQFALSYASRHPTTTRTELGLRFAKAFAMTDGTLKLKGRAAWAHDSFSGEGATATFQLLPGATFTVNGATPAPDSALVSAGADYSFGNGWSVAANFDGEFSSTTAAYAEQLAARFSW